MCVLHVGGTLLTTLVVSVFPIQMRGFCNHESFTGVGGAIPDRVDLLRIQQLRGLGGNAVSCAVVVWCGQI